MKTFILTARARFSKSVVARFGAAELVRNSGVKLQVRGGSRAEQAEAREWVSLFMHEAVLQTK